MVVLDRSLANKLYCPLVAWEAYKLPGSSRLEKSQPCVNLHTTLVRPVRVHVLPGTHCYDEPGNLATVPNGRGKMAIGET